MKIVLFVLVLALGIWGWNVHTREKTARKEAERQVAEYQRQEKEKAKLEKKRVVADGKTPEPSTATDYLNRGRGKQYNGDLVGAMADYNRALELDPEANPYEALGQLNCLSRNWTEALQNYRLYCDRRSRGMMTYYPRLAIWLIRSRLGEKEAASQELSAFIQDGQVRADLDDWKLTLADHLLGRVSEAELFAAAKSLPDPVHSQVLEAWFYAGMKRLLGGDQVAASDYFRNAIATRHDGFPEYLFAESELKALTQAPSGGVSAQGAPQDRQAQLQQTYSSLLQAVGAKAATNRNMRSLLNRYADTDGSNTEKQLEGLANGLLDSAETDADAKDIVNRWNIKRQR